MKAGHINKAKGFFLNTIGMTVVFLFLSSTVIAKEAMTISSGDMGSGRIKAEKVKPSKNISGGDLGSGRIKANKSSTKGKK